MYVRTGAWRFLGWYKDEGSRTIPDNLGNKGSPQACQAAADERNYNIVGIQAGAECWGCKDCSYNRLGGPVTDCNNPLGAWCCPASEIGSFSPPNPLPPPSLLPSLISLPRLRLAQRRVQAF